MLPFAILIRAVIILVIFIFLLTIPIHLNGELFYSLFLKAVSLPKLINQCFPVETCIAPLVCCNSANGFICLCHDIC